MRVPILSRNAVVAMAIALGAGMSLSCRTLNNSVPATTDGAPRDGVTSISVGHPTEVRLDSSELVPFASQYLQRALVAVDDTTGTPWYKRVVQFYAILGAIGLAVIAYSLWHIH